MRTSLTPGFLAFEAEYPRMRFGAVLGCGVALLAACANPPRPAVSPQPTTTAPIYFGGKPVRFELRSRPLGFDPDGNAQWLVIARFLDARGNVTRIMANSDLDWISRDGFVQWQNRMRFGQPSAIVKTRRDGTIRVIVRCNKPRLGTRTIETDTRTWHFPRVVAAPLGAYAAQIGWFPRTDDPVRIRRLNCARPGPRTWILVGVSSFGVGPAPAGRTCSYSVQRGNETNVVNVRFAPRPPDTRLGNLRGTGMWLYFTTNPLDALYYGNLNPQAIVDRAVSAHLHYVELRTAYGAFWQITPQARHTIDAIIDGLASHGIVTIGWTVPRDDAYDDVEASVRTAYYRTANGTPLGGIAVDLERGDEFMGDSPDGLAALWKYVRDLRTALGPRYLIVSTIEDPYLEHLSEQSYPYAEIAKYTTIVQPMTYARMLRRKPLSVMETLGIERASYAATAALSKRSVPINIGAQTSAIGAGGLPQPAEITAAIRAGVEAGAIGVCFFAWDGTQPPQWDALAAYRW